MYNYFVGLSWVIVFDIVNMAMYVCVSVCNFFLVANETSVWPSLIGLGWQFAKQVPRQP